MSSTKRLFRANGILFLSLFSVLNIYAEEPSDTVINKERKTPIYIYEMVPPEEVPTIEEIKEMWAKRENQYDIYPSYTELEDLLSQYLNNKDQKKGLTLLKRDLPEIVKKYRKDDAVRLLKNAFFERYNKYEFDDAWKLLEMALSIPDDSFGVYNHDRSELLYYKILLLRLLGNYQESINVALDLIGDVEDADKNEDTSYIIPLGGFRSDIYKTISDIYYELGNFDEWAKYQVRYVESELDKREYMSDEDRAYLTKGLEFFKTSDFSGDPEKTLSEFLALMYDNQLLEAKLARIDEIESDPSNQVPPSKWFMEPKLGNLYYDICFIYYFRKNYPEALNYAKKAVQLLKVQGFYYDDSYRTALEGLAKSHINLGQWGDALPLIKELLKEQTAVLPANHQFLLGNRQLLAKCLLNTGDKKAAAYAEEITEDLKSLIRNNFAYMSALERSKYWDTNSEWFFETLPIIARTFKSPKMRASVYDGLLLGKGLLLNSELEIRKLVEESDNPELIEKYNSLTAIKKQMEKTEGWDDKQKTKALSKEAQQLERDLLRDSKAFGDYTGNLSIGWKDVRNSLKANEAAVEFLAIPDNKEGTAKKHYIALIVTKESKAPEWVELFSSDAVDAIPAEEYYSGNTLYNLIWAPLEKYLKNKTTVYFAPDDNLHTIALEYLPTGNGNEIATDRKKLMRVSSTRMIARKRDDNKKIKDAALFGDILYYVDDSIQGNVPKAQSPANELLLLRGESNDNTRGRLRALARDGKVKQLPASKREIEEIDLLLQEANVDDSIFTGANASETSFKELSGKGIALIHVATHGFYLDPEEADVYDYSFLSDLPYREDEALIRSGLFFAGVNNMLSGQDAPTGSDDGVLTARELSYLDFRGLDLAVLSACQTGLGDVSGEGVFGLQRGFKKAGANTLLMSLWNVDDEATQLLMSEFYRNITSGKSKYDSLQLAREYLRHYKTTGNDGVETYKFNHPQLWGAFILLDALE